jgi:hypothetical protein
MALCASGLLLSAVILLIILNDIFSYRFNYMIEHSILGAIACTLFFTLCNYGLESINWFLLALVPIYLFIRWVYTPPPDYNENMNDECSVCEKPLNTCGCPSASEKQKTTYEINIEKKPSTCNVKAITKGIHCNDSNSSSTVFKF